MAGESRFKFYPTRPKKLSAGFAKKEYSKLLIQIEAAESAKSPSLWLKLYSDWNSLSAYMSGEGARLHHAFNLKMTDKKREAADRYFREQVIPAITAAEHELVKAFINSRHRTSVSNKFGEQLVPLYKSSLRPLDPINTKLQVEASKLTRQYDQLIAAGMIMIAGQKVTLAKARALATSSDRNLRKETFLAVSQWFLTNRPKLAKIYDELTGIRTKMAKNLGYKNYIPLAYEINCRTDYTEKDIANFRRLVQKYAVPLRLKVLQRQAQSLGLQQLRPWDGYNPETTLPLGIAPVNKQLATAQKVFNKLSPKLGRHFGRMRDKQLIDLENRPHKWASAYCTAFEDENAVAVLCSSTGDPDDISTLMHEMGHAFQKWESNHIQTVDLRWGTADLAEVYSFGMEFLSLKYIDSFFDNENSEKFRKSRWEDALQLLCYCCLVDEFQHWVYKHPAASEAMRDQAWIKIAKKYMPGIDWSGYEKFRALRWYAQNHIFNVPFYYIDYALATVVSAQIALLEREDQRLALNKYLKMCRLGGTKSFLAAVKASGLKSPFEAKVIKQVADEAAAVLL